MLGVLAAGVVDLVELPQHPGEVRLPAGQVAAQHAQCAQGGAGAEVLAVEHRLGPDQLPVELLKRQGGGDDGMLDVEQPVVARGQPPGLGVPDFRARIRCHHRQVHDLGHGQRELPDGTEPRGVPGGVDDQVDGDVDAEPAGHLQGPEVVVRADPLAVRRQALCVDSLHAEEHVAQAEPGPSLEDLPVAQQDVAAGLQVVPLADVPPLELGGDPVAVLGTDEGHVVHDEHVRLADAGQLVGRRLRRGLAVAAAVERPGGAERAVPRAAAAELDRRTRIELADEVAAAPAHQVPGRARAVDGVQGPRRRAPARQAHEAGHGLQAAVADRVEQRADGGLALAAYDRVEGPGRLLEHAVGDEGDAVPAGEDEAARHGLLGRLADLDRLWHVRQVVDRDPQRVWPERGQLRHQLGAGEHLQIHHRDIVPGLPRRGGDPFQAQRLEPQEDL